MSLVLFDIDGTLLLTGGAGIRAMTRAFAEVFGVTDAFAGISAAGRTDTYLVSQAFLRAGIEDRADQHAAFMSAYVPLLATEIDRPGAGRRGLMPGVEATLAAMAAEPTLHLALLTGNYEAAAQIKLRHFGIARYFEWGIFGEESADRNDLGRLAWPRAEQRGISRAVYERGVVIGDTPFDVECARAGALRCLAVATGTHSTAELEAAGADIVLTDLTDTRRVLDALRAAS